VVGSGDELCGPLFALFQAAAHHLPTVSLSAFLYFVYWKFMQISAPCSSLLLLCIQCPLHPLLCVLFSSLFIISFCFFFFFCSLWVSLSLVYPRDSCRNTICFLFAQLLVCVSQAGLEQASAGMGALLFSQCNVVWRSFVRDGDLGCQSFASSWCFFFFFCQVWLQHLSKVFDLWSSLCLLPPCSRHLCSSTLIHFW
jgi:hypothetical protein